MQKNTAEKVNIPMRIAGVLLILVVISVYALSSGLYARYSSSASGGDGARVAKFAVSDTLNGAQKNINVSIAPEQKLEYKIRVTNESETAVACIITAENKTGNLPLTISFKKNDADSGSTAINENFAASDGTHEYTLVIEWTSDFDAKYQGLPEHIAITVRCEQID